MRVLRVAGLLAIVTALAGTSAQACARAPVVPGALLLSARASELEGESQGRHQEHGEDRAPIGSSRHESLTRCGVRLPELPARHLESTRGSPERLQWRGPDLEEAPALLRACKRQIRRSDHTAVRSPAAGLRGIGLDPGNRNLYGPLAGFLSQAGGANDQILVSSRYFSGSVRSRSTHPWQQKRYSSSSYR